MPSLLGDASHIQSQENETETPKSKKIGAQPSQEPLDKRARNTTMISILPDNVSDDKKAEILNDHYKDTCLKLAGYRKQRNRLVFFAVIILAIIPFIVVFPAETLRLLGAFFRRASIDDLIKKTDNPQYYLFLINFLARLIL